MSLLEQPIARLDGSPATLGDLTGGKPALVVNVASKCGLTPQYTALEALHEQYAGRGLHRRRRAVQPVRRPGARQRRGDRGVLLGDYGVTFPMTEKVDVNGADRHPVYAELVRTPDQSGAAGDVQWNFEKFLVDGDGAVVARFSPQVVPDDPQVTAAIESVLS